MELHRGKDTGKDQTYFLYNLSQDKLQKIKFPLGKYTKPEVREIAKRFGLTELEDKRESQGVCFYPEKTYFEFLKRYLKPGEDFKAGTIETTDGKVVGEHTGLPFYTVGQRKGIGVGGGPALYVNKMDKIRNVLIVGNEEELQIHEIPVRELNFLSGTAPAEDEILSARVRSQGSFTDARLYQTPDGFKISFLTPETGLMPGQSVVLYRGTELVGGGIMS